MTREDCYLWLSSLNFMGPEQKAKAMEAAGDIEELAVLSGEDLFDCGINLNFLQIQEFRESRSEEKMAVLKKVMSDQKIRYVSMEDPEFPTHLTEISVPPVGLFVRGSLPPENGTCVSVIGARKCSGYGREMAGFIAGSLAAAGCSIISGMAMGIDGYAERGALEQGKPAYSVLAGGPDICYPQSNVDIFTACRKSGGILSERAPGYYARSYNFPERNRIISALSDAVVVIEAAVRSGSLITVNYALDQGKEVFALPGRVGDYLSGGCNELIKAGAHCMTCPEDVLQYLGLKTGKDRVPERRQNLSPEEKVILSFLSREAVSTDELLEKSSFALSELLRVLLSLEMKGVIRKTDLSGYVIV